MRIITNYQALELESLDLNTIVLEGEDSLSALREELFSAIRSAYLDAVTDDEIDLYKDYNENRFIFGGFDREKLIQAAQAWNDNIRADFMTALQQIGIEEGKPCPSCEALPMATPATYRLQQVTRQLDNYWFDLADFGVYLPNDMGYPYFQVVLSNAQLQDIAAHPDQYLILDVCPKN